MQISTSKRFIDPANMAGAAHARCFWLGYYYFINS